MAIKYINITNNTNPLAEYLKNHKVEIEANGERVEHMSNMPAGKIEKIKLYGLVNIPNNDLKTRHEERVTIICDQGKFESLDSVRPFVENMFTNNTFDNHKTTLGYTHYGSDSDSEKGMVFENIYSHYNFRIKEYEDITKENISSLPETSLPMHLVGLYRDAYPTSQLSSFYYNIWNTPTDKKMTRKFPSSVNKNHKMFTHHENYNFSENYFQNFADIGKYAHASSTQTNVFVAFDFPRSSGNNVYDVPFYNSIYLHFDGTKGDFRKAFQDQGLSEVLMKMIHSAKKQGIRFKNETNDTETSFPAFDISDAMNEIDVEDILARMQSGEDMYLFDPDKSLLMWENPALIQDINKAIVHGSLKNIMEDNAFGFGDTFLNKKYHLSEMVCYRIEKYLTRRQATPVQVFYFLNHGAAKDFIDTQVKFGKSYTYAITGIYFVPGNSCSFEVDDVRVVGDKVQIEARFVVKPSLKMIEIPVTRKALLIVEPPPLPPLIKIKNHKYKKYKISIDIEERQGILISKHDRKKLQIIKDEDTTYKSQVELYAGTNYPYYSHIASDGTFEIYRTEEKPKSIRDFEGKLYYLLTTGETDARGKRKSQLSFIDYVAHGRKYYYLFRSLTHNGNPSNPSPIYVVEKIKDADESMLKVSTLNLEEEEEYSMDISFRGFINMSIRDIHLEIDPKSYLNDDGEQVPSAKYSNLILGRDGNEDSVWRYNDLSNSYIKLRLESKNSGKKIDFNLIFNYNKPKNVS